MKPNKRISHGWRFMVCTVCAKAMLVIVLVLTMVTVPHDSVFAQQENQLFTFDIAIVRSNCQISVWLEDAAGNVIKTICVATKTAKQGLGTYRPHVLPVWAYRHGDTYGEGSIYPTVEDPLPDAVTTASPPTGQLEKSWEPVEPVASGEYNFYVEINKSFDSNEYFPDGEPSIIWRGSVNVGNEDDSGTAAIIGHGDEDGDNGTIYSDMTTITLSDDYMTGATLVYTAGSQINNPPQITTVSLPDATEDTPYSHQVEATDPDSEDTVSFNLLTGPDWLELSTEGLLSGTPSESDTGEDIPVTIRASDNGDLADTLATTISVIGLNHPPEITTTTLPDAVVDQLYSQTVSSTDSDSEDTVSFNLLAGPDWLELSTEGLLTGTPSDNDAGEDIPVTIRASDNGSLADTLATTITVIGLNHPPQITTATLPDAMVDQLYSQTVAATDTDSEDTVSFNLLAGPDWLELSTEGLLTGTPSESDTGENIPVTIRASDNGGLADTLATTITVIGLNHPPQITTATLPDAMVDIPYTHQVEATDSDSSDTVSFNLLTGPDWLELSTEGLLSGTPSESDTGDSILVAIRVYDDGGRADTLNTAINVMHQTAVETINEIDTYSLYPPYPNPCNAGTMISYELPAEGMVYLAICDILGRTVNILVNETVTQGRHDVWWDGTNGNGALVGTGSYFYLFRSGSYSTGGKITVLK